MTRPVLFVLGRSAMPLATQLKEQLSAEIHAPRCVPGGDVVYDKATSHLGTLFAGGRSIIGLCAAAILIRAVAPKLKDKQSEPPVIAVSEDGATVVPLLGGHHGANALARRIASLTSGHAGLTTASDVRLGFSLDMPAEGFTLNNPEHMKPATAALLNGSPLAITGRLSPFPKVNLAVWTGNPDSILVEVTESLTSGSERHLIYHPRTLVMGLGCERGAEPQELISLSTAALAREGLSPAALAAVASIDLKEDEPAIHAVARHFGVPAHFFSADELRHEESRLVTPSDVVLREVGVSGVAEAAALAAAGDSAVLIVPKVRSQRGTCAIARSSTPVLSLPGRPQGRLLVVGIGPGTPAWRTPAATAALLQATDWVGYGLYLDLVSDLHSNQLQHRFPLGAEEDRVRHAIVLASSGRDVALICSGDAGIYAMAALVYELTELQPSRIAIDVIPGISAFQAAAAKAGAMIGHDFCCISLSDLLTPWEVIENRIRAAATGDFVAAFYNPRSLKRRGQLERALDLLRPHRPATTPVIIASNLGRSEEVVKIETLATVNPDDVDMLTIVMVGSSQSRMFMRGDGSEHAYTPRGYARKREAGQ